MLSAVDLGDYGGEMQMGRDEALAAIPKAKPRDASTLAEELLAEPGGREHVRERLNDPRFGGAAWQVAHRDVLRQASRAPIAPGSDDGRAWIDAGVEWLVAADADWPRSMELCADAAWQARGVGNSALLHLDADDVIAAWNDSPTRGRALAHLYLYSLRYDFRLEPMEELVRLLGDTSLDPGTKSLYAFALLGRGDPRGLVEADAALAAAPHNAKVTHAILHGLWLGDRLPDQSRRILDLIDTSPAISRTDAVAHFRKAYALRRLDRYDEALDAIDIATANLDPAAVDVHQDFVRERSLILTMRDIHELNRRDRQLSADEAQSHRQELADAVHEETSEVRRQISDSTFRLVEVLGLFSGILAIIIGGVSSAAIGRLEWWERLITVVGTGVVVLAFFFALRYVVQPRRDRR